MRHGPLHFVQGDTHPLSGVPPIFLPMLPILLALQVTAPQHDALRYDITLVPSDTGTHLLGEVETAWRLAS